VLEVGVGLLAGLLLFVGFLIMAGPAVTRTLRPFLRRRSLGFPRPSSTATPAANLHPTTGKALAVAARLATMLRAQGMERHVAALRHASRRLELNEADGIYAMQEVLRRLRGVRLADGDDQEIVDGLVGQLRKALNDRAEQLELLPRS
jgi:hypothetical protein